MNFTVLILHLMLKCTKNQVALKYGTHSTSHVRMHQNSSCSSCWNVPRIQFLWSTRYSFLTANASRCVFPMCAGVSISFPGHSIVDQGTLMHLVCLLYKQVHFLLVPRVGQSVEVPVLAKCCFTETGAKAGRPIIRSPGSPYVQGCSGFSFHWTGT